MTVRGLYVPFRLEGGMSLFLNFGWFVCGRTDCFEGM